MSPLLAAPGFGKPGWYVLARPFTCGVHHLLQPCGFWCCMMPSHMMPQKDRASPVQNTHVYVTDQNIAAKTDSCIFAARPGILDFLEPGAPL